MKKQLIPLIFFVLFTACNTSQTIHFQKKIEENTKNCLQQGTCKIAFLPNKAISFKKDAQGNTYPVISEGNKTIFKYTFTKEDKKIQDSFYSEIIYAELDSTTTKINLKNNQLQKIKLHFGRLCFCKGQTGYYPITNGYFKLKKINANTINVQIKFENEKVPQLIKHLNESISIK